LSFFPSERFEVAFLERDAVDAVERASDRPLLAAEVQRQEVLARALVRALGEVEEIGRLVRILRLERLPEGGEVARRDVGHARLPASERGVVGHLHVPDDAAEILRDPPRVDEPYALDGGDAAEERPALDVAADGREHLRALPEHRHRLLDELGVLRVFLPVVAIRVCRRDVPEREDAVGECRSMNPG
jgi:hypothetical protein